MQPKTDKQFGWFGLLTIAIVSGLIVKIVGDPLVEVITPKLERTAKKTERLLDHFLDDQDWGEKLHDWLDRVL
jgi:hypothetical protein